MDRDLAQEEFWYFDGELDQFNNSLDSFAILASPPELEMIARSVPAKSIAYLMSAAPQLLSALRECRPFVIDQPEILRKVDRAIAWAEGHPQPYPDAEKAIAEADAFIAATHP